MCKIERKPIPPATMTKLQVVRKLEEDIMIHETWIGLITEHPETYPPQTWGDEEFHLGWIEVYQNAIHYLRKGD